MVQFFLTGKNELGEGRWAKKARVQFFLSGQSETGKKGHGPVFSDGEK